MGSPHPFLALSCLRAEHRGAGLPSDAESRMALLLKLKGRVGPLCGAEAPPHPHQTALGPSSVGLLQHGWVRPAVRRVVVQGAWYRCLAWLSS